jgi:hypothetical protein
VTNKKIGYLVATILLVILLVGGLFPWLSYYFTLEDQEKEWYRTQYIQKDFKGVIMEIGDYSYNPDFQEEYLNITIATGDTLEPEIHYGMLSFKKEPLLKAFISEGDSAIKTKNNKDILFKKPDGRTKTFKLPIDIKE